MANKWIAIVTIVVVLANLMVVEAHEGQNGKGKGKKSHSDDSHEESKGHHGKGKGSKEHHGKGGKHHGPHNMTCGWIDGNQTYDFSWLSHRTFSNDATEVYFSFCRTIGQSDNRTTIPADCDSEANVCVKVDGKYVNGGKSETKWSTIENGVAMSFEDGEVCDSEKSITRSTIVEISCNPDQRRFTIKSVESNGCTTVVKAESKLACQRSEDEGSDAHGDGNRHGSNGEEDGKKHGKHGKPHGCHKRKTVIIASSVGGGIIAIALIVVIVKCVRRRRQRLAIRRFEEEQVGLMQHVQQPMVPAYEAFNPDASMAFPHIEMYPVQIVTQGNQVDADAELARRLQEQFNRGL